MHDAAAFDALAAQVNELARVCARLTEENAELRSRVSALSGSALTAMPAMTEMTATQITPATPATQDGVHTTRISRRAAVGVALAGAAAGIAGVTAVTERSGRAAPAAAGAELPAVELTAVEQQAAATSGSLINGSLSTASAVIAGANTSTGPGVHATSSHGRGGIFAGGAAQVQLTPAGSSHPKSGQRGDLYADAAGRLWYCKASGATATWHQIA
jgi:hypothetical protein